MTPLQEVLQICSAAHPDLTVRIMRGEERQMKGICQGRTRCDRFRNV